MAGFFSRLFGKSTQQITPTPYVWGRDALIEHALYGSVTVTASQALNFYRSSSAIATAVDLIASKIEAIDPVLEIDGEIQDEDEVTDFLAKPNDFHMWRTFIGEAARHFLLTGNSYLIGLGTVNQKPVEIYNGHPIDIAPFSTITDGFPDRYSFNGQLAPGTYTREDRPRSGVRFVDGPLRELYHIKGFTSRTNHATGDSPIESIVLEIKQHIAGRQHNANMLSQGGRLSLLVLLKDAMPIEQFKEFMSRMKSDLGGSMNAGKIAGISGKEMDVKEMGVTNKDMDYVNLDEVATRVSVQPATPDPGDVTVLFVRDNDANIIPSAVDVENVRDVLLEILPGTSEESALIVSAPTPVTQDFVFSAIDPNTEDMQDAIRATLEAFSQDQVEIGQTITSEVFEAAIAQSVTGSDVLTSFTLTTPGGDIVITADQIAILGDVTFP